jgi:ATP synthase protein I
MQKADDPREEAASLDKRIDAFEAKRTADKPRSMGDHGSGDGYRLLADLIGGILGGLGFGWLFDRFAHTGPFGLIGGMLIGTGMSVYLVVRSAGRMSKAAAAANPAKAALDDTDDEEPGIFGLKRGDE